MMEIIFLGTGHAAVTECFNTSFLLKENDTYLLVDTGGGNGLLKQLKAVGVKVEEISAIFISHQHLDHLLGSLWIFRHYAHFESQRQIKLYSHKKVIDSLVTLIETLFTESQIEKITENIDFIRVEDGERLKILGCETTFFDIDSKKEVQYGFKMDLKDGSLLFLGDEPCSKSGEKFLEETTWLLHEAFCTDKEKERFRPHEKSHSTVKEAAELAERAEIKNLILFHSEDSDLKTRESRYREEGERYYTGDLYIPSDLERIVIES